jgi:nudix-type nucleoside diphosphatase (YffH/AdpP family)
MTDRVKVLSQKLLSHAWARLTQYELEVERRDGTRQLQIREVYDRGNAACVLLCNFAQGTVILTRQLRFPAQLNGDDPYLIEACAGLLDGDTPEVCARKEAAEETGYEVGDLTHLFDSYMSPGSVNEKLAFFRGTYDPAHRVGNGGGLAHEGEDIEVMELPFDTALAMVASGEITDAKTIMLLQHTALSGVFRA